MSTQMRGSEPAREFHLEGLGLAVVGGVLIAVMFGAFYTGRWYERQVSPVVAGSGGGANPLANVTAPEQESANVDADLNYFDTLDGAEKQAEPTREIQAARTPVERPAPAAPAPAPSSGDFFVQVFAGRDQGAAAGLVQRLESEGRMVKLHTIREGSDALFKVRVGGYQTRETARAAAQELQSQGYPGAWVTEVQGSL